MLRRLFAHIARRFASPSTLALYHGAIVSICLASLCLQWTALLGTSFPVALALLVVMTLAIGAGSTPIAFIRRLALPGLENGALLYFVLATWMVASPWLLEFILWAIARPGAISLTSPVWNTVTLVALAAPFLGLPSFLAVPLATGPDSADPNRTRQVPYVLAGAAIGLVGWSMGLAQIVGPSICGILAAGLGLLVAVVRSLRSSANAPDFAACAPASAEAVPCVSAVNPEQELPTIRRLPLAAILAVACGGWVAALGILLEQLIPGTVYLVSSEAVGLCLGLAAGLGMARRRQVSDEARERMRFWSLCALAVWGVGVLGAFPLEILAALNLNVYVSSPTLLLLARGTIAAVMILPVGFVSAFCLAPSESHRPVAQRGVIGSRLIAVLLGFSAVASWAFSRFGLELILVGLAWWTLAVAGLTAMKIRREIRSGWPQRLLVGAVVKVVFIAPLWRHNFDPPRSAKLLFNSNAAYAYRTGFGSSLLMSLDEGRHLATTAGQGSLFTVWRYGGHQLQIRENGIPLGVVSTDADTFPRFVPETMPVALPLTLHEKAERLLLLGLGTGEALTTGLSFPVSDVVCLEANAGLIRVVREVVGGESGKNPLDDERLTLCACDGALGLGAAEGEFDAIVSSPGHLSLAHAQPFLTLEFYQRVARKLATGGIFCQRLNFVDFGPRPLQKIVRTTRCAFRDVLVLEVAPGDFVLAATNDSGGLIRPGLAARLELPQMRAVCAASGIDWTVILNLGTFNQHGLARFTANSSPTPESAANGRFPMALPREVIRWGPKLQEVQEALSPSRNRLLTWIEDADSPVLIRRLAEVQGQFDLMTKYSDQYWAYRASLRSQVKDKPRSQIRLASATTEEKEMHPEDRRRLRYFQVLGRAVQSRRAADIERLARFAAPYDPLISYFVHQEAAELYSRSTDRDVVQELRHRLYSTFFSSPNDASLRNVVAALKLLREHPESEPDPQVRWDDLNALLQALKLRWDARTGTRPANVREVIEETDATILAAEQTFQVLDRLTTEAAIPESTWRNRREVLEKTLLRPVKAYQLELLPYLHRRNTEKAPADDENPPDEN